MNVCCSVQSIRKLIQGCCGICFCLMLHKTSVNASVCRPVQILKSVNVEGWAAVSFYSSLMNLSKKLKPNFVFIFLGILSSLFVHIS